MSQNHIDEPGIIDFCERILPDFNSLVNDFQKIHPEWSENDLAGNLMEFGRGQISGIDAPTENDIGFMKKYTGSLDFNSSNKRLFAAYAAGCIMGLVQSNQLPTKMFIDAVNITRKFSNDILRT